MPPSLQLDPSTELTDLHIHVGGAVAPHILWAIAHDSGFKLPVKSYWDFCELVYADPTKVSSLGDYLDIMHRWTEKIQSSPAAIERSIYEVIGKEYRSSRVSTIELRFNPMKRNVGGERDLDYIIAAALRGMDRACLDYGVKAGLIFCLAREFEYDAQRDHRARRRRSGAATASSASTSPGPSSTRSSSAATSIAIATCSRARAPAGLGTTVHTGETTHTGPEGVLAVIEKLKPARIGHGIAAAQSDEAMRKLVERGIVLELCPSSNLRTHAVADVADLRGVFERLRARGRAPDHQHRRHLPPRHDAAQGVRSAARRRESCRSGGAHVHRQRPRRQLHPALRAL